MIKARSRRKQRTKTERRRKKASKPAKRLRCFFSGVMA